MGGRGGGREEREETVEGGWWEVHMYMQEEWEDEAHHRAVTVTLTMLVM